ncbi:hypothetical protein [Reinekea sp.]|jgi:FtsH-binding integral membrane protein|uniref:hypothetical protein n=1 Tax=Reinekea sp. TaxID=1970455 RepID=UPI003988BB3B
MKSSFEELKKKLLSTRYPRWRNIVSTTVLTLTCLGMVGSFVYLYFTISDLSCYKGILIAAVVWLIVELIAIAYLFLWTNIPSFARDVVKLNIAFANIWFGLLIFSLNACGK